LSMQAAPLAISADSALHMDFKPDAVFVTLRAYQITLAPAVVFDPVAVPPGIAITSQAVDILAGVEPPLGTLPAAVIKIAGTSFVVTNNGDSAVAGSGSLRAAILASNSTPGRDTIIFNIPGPGLHTIAPASALPTISDPVILDATTQPGFAGSPVIELNGRFAGATGLSITAGNSIVRGLVINRFTGEGILLLTGGGNRIEGNYIGTDAAGVADLGNTNSGIFIPWSDGNVVVGNVISGNNGFAAIAICGSTSCGGGSRPLGSPTATGNVVQGNFIGTNALGSSALGNSGYGVSIDGAPNTLVGGTTAGAGNVIANSGLAGVVVFNPPTSGNRILRNSIHSNGGLGIDLAPDGVTANDTGDPDPGPNNLQNFPVLTSAYHSGASTLVQVSLNTTASTPVVIDFFSNPTCDATGNGEGQTYVASVTRTTDSSGNLTFSTDLPGLADGMILTAVATSASGTSEFSACRTVTPFPSGLAYWPVSAGGNGHVYEYVQTAGTWTAANAAAPTRSFSGVAGHLVTITSSGENNVVGSLRGATNDLRGWIGLTDSVTEGTFLWVTGEPFPPATGTLESPTRRPPSRISSRSSPQKCGTTMPTERLITRGTSSNTI